ALARAHGHIVRATGPDGGRAVQWRGVQRQPGETKVRSGLQTSNGRGYRTERDASWGDGQYAGSRETTLNNGKSFGHSTTFTGPQGNSRTVTGTVTRDR